jgi:ribonuclease P protein component
LAKQFTLGKNERLKSRKIIEQLFSEGKSFAFAPFRIYYLLNESTTPSLQFGTGVSAKNFKKAVDRNRVKRVIREAWRLQKNQLQEAVNKQNRQLNVFFIYTAKDLPLYKEIHEKTGKVINRLCTII